MPSVAFRLLIDARYQPAPTELVRALIAAAGDLDIHVWLPLPDSDARRAWGALLHHSRLHVAPGPRLETATPPGWTRTAAEWLEAAAIVDLAPDIVWTPADPARVDACHPPPCTDLTWVLTQPSLPAPDEDLHAQTAERPELARHWQWLKQATAVWAEDAAGAAILSERLLLAPEAAHHFKTTDPDTRARALLDCFRAHCHEGAGAAQGDTRPTLAFVSPLPPERSGIADYSAELLPELARHYRLTLVCAGEPTQDPWLRANFEVIDLAGFRVRAGRFDHRLYQLGNSHFHAHMLELIAEYPGVAVLHDFFLGHLQAWRQTHGREPAALIRALFESHGWPALAYLSRHGEEAALWRFPANRPAAASATGVIVHSRHAIDLAREWLGPDLETRFCYIPHLRRPVPMAGVAAARARARAELGLGERDFLVCSFGFIGLSKRSRDLLAAWLSSALSRRPEARLVFVGKNCDGAYGRALQREIDEQGQGRVHITGYAPAAEYRRWLAAADLAVQLRTCSRGETSGTVLDCLAHGVPLIVNSHGSMADLSAHSVEKLSDACPPDELREALERLYADAGRRAAMAHSGREDIRRVHDPVVVAAAYRDAIEAFARRSPVARHRRLIARLGAGAPSMAELDSVLDPLARLDPAAGRAQGRWFVDISALRQATHITGIERVTHELLLALLADAEAAERIVPVQAGDQGYRTAWDYPLRCMGLDSGALGVEPVRPQAGDLFFGLDWMPGVIPRERARLVEWRARGVRLWFLIHDILPVTHPHWFPRHLPPIMRQWLLTLAELADGCVCVSATTAEALADWWRAEGIESPPSLVVSHNGADPVGYDPEVGLPAALERALAARPTLLMVGTIEPRKGHAQAFAALDLLWSEGVDVNLVVVGRAGWPNDSAEERRPIVERAAWLNAHPERERRLFWPDDVDDRRLAALYRRCSALLACAEAEGFGLPLIEAAYHGLPLIARDIPIFREVAGDGAWYFAAGPDPDGAHLAADLRDWLSVWRAGGAPDSAGVRPLSWSASAARLRDLLRADLGEGDLGPRPAVGLSCNHRWNRIKTR